MSAFAEKLKDIGVAVLGSQFRAACVEAVKEHPNHVGSAWTLVGKMFGHEYLRSMMGPMAAVEPTSEVVLKEKSAPKPYQPRVIAPERMEKRAELRHVLRSKFRNSGDVPWSDVCWSDLRGLERDGVEAKALLDAGPKGVPNDGRTVGEVLGVEKTDAIIAKVRSKT